MKLKSPTTTLEKRVRPESLLPLITPGDMLAEEFLMPLGLSANALALDLRVQATRVHAILRGRRSITADTALRLGRYFGNSAEFWLNLQQQYDLDSARRHARAQKLISYRFCRHLFAQSSPQESRRFENRFCKSWLPEEPC